MAQGKYIRVYHVLKDEYPGVWRSDAQLALFVRLLLVADKWYPEWAPIPSRTPAYRSLVESGLVTENISGNGYSILGLHKERARRSEHARHAVRMRWEYAENTAGIPSKAEQSKAEQKDGKEPPQTFMGWKPSAHMGQHTDCLVCAPLQEDKP